MNNYQKIRLKIEEFQKTFLFYFVYDENTTVESLIDFFNQSIRGYYICDCFKFQIKIRSYKYDNYEWVDLNNTSQLNGYFNRNEVSCRFIKKDNNICQCNNNDKNLMIKTKKEIITILSEKIADAKKANIDEIEKLKNINSLNQNNINQLTQENNTLKNKNSLNQKNINQLTQENNTLKNKYYLNQNNINQLTQENNTLKNKNFKLKEDIKNLEKELSIFQKNVEKLKLEKEILEQAINGDTNIIKILNKYGITGKYLVPKKDSIQIDKEGKFIFSQPSRYKKPNSIEFYDIIIDIKSVKDIIKGIEIKMSKRAKENYKDFISKELIKIGIIGNANKGKSFFLSRLSKINLPSSTSIRTEGLSIKYPELNDIFKNRNIALLDSAGQETPVLNDEIESQDTDSMAYFKEKSREKLITELFLQNYIIYNSDILIVVVGILTYSEQKLLNKIKKEIEREKLEDKPLYILHNLMTYTSVEQVEQYIKDYLLNSVTFKLKEGHKITTDNEIMTGKYFHEINTKQKIFHLIYANEDSPAGEYYNKYTLNFFKHTYQQVTNLKSFDVIKTVKERFMKLSKEIFEKFDKTLTEGDFDNSNYNLIKLNNPNTVTLKRCLIDELGFSNLKGNGFNPAYNYYKKDNKIILRIEAPGNSSISSTNIEIHDYTVISINGLKKKDKEPEKLEDNIDNSREYGEFNLIIVLKNQENELVLKNQPPKINEKRGIIILEYELENKNEGGKYIVKEEDEI